MKYNLKFYINTKNNNIQLYITNMNNKSNYKRKMVDLPPNEILDLLELFKKSNYAMKSDKQNYIELFTFKNVDEITIKNLLEGDISQINLNTKITRKNKFSLKPIICSATALIAFLSSLGGLSSTNINEKADIIHIKEQNEEMNDSDIENNIDNSNNTKTSNISTFEDMKTMVDKLSNIIKIEISCDLLDEDMSFKYNNALKYFDIINEIAPTYGLDPYLVLAIATQERSEHSTIRDDGGAMGLMQIQFDGWSWEDKEVSAYNFDKNIWETITINEEDAKDLKTNIKYGCFILANSLRENNYNLLQAIQGYNSGKSAVDNAIFACSYQEGISVDNIKEDQNNTSWIKYNDEEIGDKNYVANVIRYLPPEKIIELKMVDENNNVEELYFKINNNLERKRTQ